MSEYPKGVSGVQREKFLSLTDQQKAVYLYHYKVMGQPAALCYRYAIGELS